MVRQLGRVEMIAMLAAGLVASIGLFNGALTGSWLLLAIAVVTVMVAWIVARDMIDFTIPDGAVFALAIAGVVVRLSISSDVWAFALALLLLDGALCGLAFLCVREVFFRIKGFDGMGFGDVKLAAASGVLVGMEGFAWSVFVASAIGLVVAVVIALFRPGTRIERLPFGALLAPACWAVWIMQLWSPA